MILYLDWVISVFRKKSKRPQKSIMCPRLGSLRPQRECQSCRRLRVGSTHSGFPAILQSPFRAMMLAHFHPPEYSNLPPTGPLPQPCSIFRIRLPAIRRRRKLILSPDTLPPINLWYCWRMAVSCNNLIRNRNRNRFLGIRHSRLVVDLPSKDD